MGNSNKKQASHTNMSSEKGGGYPSQQGQGYPSQPPVNYQQQPPQGYVPSGNPPPYAPPMQQGQPPYMPTQPHPHYAQGQPPQYQQQPQTIHVQGGFEAGARFDVGATPNIPPPPPGCAPNAAQMAAAQGHNVTVSQQKGGFMSGTGDGGYTVW